MIDSSTERTWREPFRGISSIDLLASEHAARGRSGLRVVVLLGGGIDRVEIVVDDRIDGFGFEGLRRSG